MCGFVHFARHLLCCLSGKPLFQMSDLTDKRHESMCYIFQLCYRVIQHAQQDYRKNQVGGVLHCVLHIHATYSGEGSSS